MSTLKVSRYSREVLSNVLRGNSLVKPFSSGKIPEEPLPTKNFDDIPGPKPLPVVGNLWRYYKGKYPLDNMPLTYEGYLNEYGPLVKEHLFFGRTLVHVFDPMDMKRIYNEDRFHTPTRISHRALEKYRRDRIAKYNNGGLASSNGEEWEKLRRSLGEWFLHENSNAAFEDITKDLMEEIHQAIAFKQNKECALLPLLYNWSLECMGSVILGQRIGSFEHDPNYRIAKFIRSIRDSQEAVFYTENLPGLLTRRYYKQLVTAQDFIHEFLQMRINKVTHRYHMVDIKPDQLWYDEVPIRLHRSLAFDLARKELDIREIKTFIIDMFQGGIHSPAHILAFALYYLAIHPEIQKAIRASLIEKFPSVVDSISSKPIGEDIKNVIRETMRLNPPTIGTGRVLPVSLVLSGYRVPKGTMCILHHQIASKRGSYFKNPGEFIPDRFKEDLLPAALVANSPFALGRRACPGKDVTMNELGIALSKLLRNFELSYNYEKVGMKNSLVNEPDKEIKLTFQITKV